MHASDIPQISLLSIPEKIQLVEEIWDAIALEESSIPVPLGHQDELDRRWKAHESNPDELLSLDELKSTIERQL